jgi:murein DD-endopeptidase MepM/ murein hydrolase activator NlpD
MSGADRSHSRIEAGTEAGIEDMNRTRFGDIRDMARILAQTTALLAAAGCASTQSPSQAEVEIKGSDPAATSPAAPAEPASTVPDARGIVTYDGYEAAVARSGDTVASVAGRIGLSASELGAYNGLSPTHPLQPGDELILPPRPGGYSAGEPVAGTDPAATLIEAAPIQAGSIQAGPIEAEPLQAGAAATDPASSGGAAWSPDLAAAAIDRAAGFDEQGNLAEPPSAEEPLPPNPQPPGELTSPKLRQYQTPVLEPLAPGPPPRPVETITTPEEQVVEDNAAVAMAATAPEPPVEFRLIRPVVGPVVVGFNQGAGRARNDGIDFASPAGATVVAAASGEVALVSQSLGGLGTIVLLRHPGDYLTVYGRIEGVKVAKGDFVNQGQKIGVVSPSTQPRMHFEVRHGADSMDPERLF